MNGGAKQPRVFTCPQDARLVSELFFECELLGSLLAAFLMKSFLLASCLAFSASASKAKLNFDVTGYQSAPVRMEATAGDTLDLTCSSGSTNLCEVGQTKAAVAALSQFVHSSLCAPKMTKMHVQSKLDVMLMLRRAPVSDAMRTKAIAKTCMPRTCAFGTPTLVSRAASLAM